MKRKRRFVVKASKNYFGPNANEYGFAEYMDDFAFLVMDEDGDTEYRYWKFKSLDDALRGEYEAINGISRYGRELREDGLEIIGIVGARGDSPLTGVVICWNLDGKFIWDDGTLMNAKDIENIEQALIDNNAFI